jgi:hypothetical protein
MALNRIPCPECGAGLKSATGFTVGQTVCCPKCETYFNVEEPAEDNEDAEEKESPKKVKSSTPSNKAKAAGGKKPVKAAAMSDDDDDDREDDEEDEDDKPKKKKKKKKRRDDDDDDEEERSYKNSPLRYAILGILIIVMLVGAFFLYKKYQKEHGDDTASTKPSEENSTPSRGPAIPAGGGRPNAKFVPIDANKNGPQISKGGFPKGKSNDSLIPGGILGSNPLTPAEKTKFTQQLRTQLIGTWKADLGDGVTAQLMYTADGKVTETVTTPKGTQTTMGTWTAKDVVRRDTLPLTLVWSGTAGTTDVKLVFEDDELQHPVLGQGVIGIFRKG